MLRHLLRKEVKELLMERSILIGAVIMPLIIFPLMGALTGLGMGAAVERTAGFTVGLADLDKTNLTMMVLPSILREEGIQLVKIKCSAEEECIRTVAEKNIKLAVIVPNGFSKNFTAGLQSRIGTVYTIRSATLSDITMSQRFSEVILEAFRSLAEKIHGRNIDPSFFERPVLESSTVFYLGRVMKVPFSMIASIFLTTIFGLPMVAVIVASYASTVSATSIALEKTSKTLEILLMIPARRITILLSKLLGTFVIVLLSTISFLVGFGIYGLMLAGSISTRIPAESLEKAGPQIQLNLLELQPSPTFIPIMVSSIFIAMVMMTCIGLLVGILGSDVRSAQQLVGAITFPLLMPPFFILLFTPIESLPLGVRLGLLADPFTHLFLAIQSGFMGDLASAALSMGVMLVFTIILLLLSSWLFMGERLITMRITIRKRAAERGL